MTSSAPPDVLLTFTHDAVGGASTKARIRYALPAVEVVIDTARRADGEMVRTRRAARLVPPVQATGNYAAIGVVTDPDWTPTELEAVRRLWTLRNEWREHVLAGR
jgi:hypothetical protein